jgi:MFS family permease
MRWRSPFLGPLGDRFGKQRCIQVCVAGLALMLAAGAFADRLRPPAREPRLRRHLRRRPDPAGGSPASATATP